MILGQVKTGERHSARLVESCFTISFVKLNWKALFSSWSWHQLLYLLTFGLLKNRRNYGNCKQHCNPWYCTYLKRERNTKTPETNISTSFAKLHLLMPTNICSGAPLPHMTAGHSSLQTTIFTMKLVLPLFWPFDTKNTKSVNWEKNLRHHKILKIHALHRSRRNIYSTLI